MAQLILFNKPFRVLSQFSDKEGKTTLAAFIEQAGVYPAGRLDYDSEGLLLLTDDGKMQARIAEPKFKLPKHYWVQVEGRPSHEAMEQLRKGLMLKDGLTAPAKAEIIPPPDLWERHPPVRERANIPTSWIELVIKEGRNRQVRRMTAAVGHPTLRLIRHTIGPWSLRDLAPGEFRSEQAHLPKTQTNSASRQSKTTFNDRKARPGKAPGAYSKKPKPVHRKSTPNKKST